jgi:hypothetical protein
MVSLQINQSEAKETKHQSLRFRKRTKVRTVLLLPVIVIGWFVGFSFNWIDSRRAIIKANKNQHRNMQFNVLLAEKKYVK